MAQDATAPAKNPDTSVPSNQMAPVEQGNSKADVTMTANIRKDILADKNMSVSAQNVKIFTNTGKVTLRGQVNTADEKRRIGEIAGKYARAENVENQIEVKPLS
jgi:osmotically-inducible protein OsmY